MALILARTALDDRRPEQTRRSRRDEMVADRHPPGRFTGNGDLLWIAAEVRYVVAHPSQRGLLISEAVIADITVVAEGRMREEA